MRKMTQQNQPMRMVTELETTLIQMTIMTVSTMETMTVWRLRQATK